MSDVGSSSELYRPYKLNVEDHNSSNVDTLKTEPDPIQDNDHENQQASPYSQYYQLASVPHWNLSSTLPNHTQPSNTLSPIFSPTVTSPHPMTYFPFGYPYSFPTVSANYALYGSSAYSSYLQNPDAEVSYYSWLSRDENETSRRSPSIDRNTLTPSSVCTDGTETPTELDQCENSNDTSIRSSFIMNQRLKMKTPARRIESYKLNYPYRRHPKPPYTFCGMITTVIENSPEKRLTLNQVCDQMYDMFECFRRPYQGWRDSVRHNLSHHSCFVLDGVAETKREEKKRCHYWVVDLEKVPIGAFCIQRKSQAIYGTYKNHIHEELGLPQILLPSARNGVECLCTHSLSALTKKSKQLLEKSRKQSRTPAPPTSDVKRLQLPVMDACNLPSASPEVYRNRDVFNSSFHSDGQIQCALESMKTENSTDITMASESGVQHGSEFAHACNEPDMEFQSISQYIMSTEGIHGPTNAVENLSYLCLDTTNE